VSPTTTTSGGIAISVRALTKHFGAIVAVDGLDLDVPAGSVFGLLGPNGAGKTTTIRILTGLARPTAGEATIGGVEVGLDRPELRRRVGYLDQDPRFYSWMRGRELLELVGRLHGLEGNRLLERVEQTLARTGLAEAANRRIGAYSGGMRQRLGIAQALVHEPELLILDEPVSSLDPEGRRDLLGLLASLRETSTVLFSTHVLADVERVCDRVAILDRGRLVIESNLPELLSAHAQPIYRIVPEPGQDDAFDALVRELSRLPWTGAVDRRDGELRVTVTDPERAGREILPALAATGIRLATLERVRPTLEDVFLELVGPRRPEELDGRGFVRPREIAR
jgi:ABC-2 type transport system ATP-binding protein